MKIFLSKIKNYLLKHKVISVIAILIIIFAGYKIYVTYTSTSGETRYVVSAVGKGTIINVVSGTGQVSAKNQIDLKAKASGEIVYLGAKTGSYVNAGQLIMWVDSRNAEIDLQNAKLSLQKMTEGTDLSLGQSGGLAKDYEDAIGNVNNVFSDLPAIMAGFDTLLNNYQASLYKINLPTDTAKNYYNQATKSYYLVKKTYDKTLADYQNFKRPFSNEDVVSIVDKTYLLLKEVNQLAREVNTYVTYVYDYSEENVRTTAMIDDKSNISTWLKTLDEDLALIGADRDTFKNSKLNIESQNLAVKQKEYAYQDYFLYAPSSGLVQIDVNQNDSISNGSSIGTLISSQKIATVSLNEVDITKVKIGQKAILTFDAIDGLTIAGEVAEADLIGTVSQGVVSYNVKIAFATQDPRIKSGMSVSADIATEVKQDVLVVPSSALKSGNDSYYVETFGAAVDVTDSQGLPSTLIPEEITVATGLSDDTNTEILGGLKEGDKIITQTLAASAVTKSAASITSLLRPSSQQKRSN